MQRKFLGLFGATLGYCFMGNVLGAVMTMSLYFLATTPLVMAGVQVLALCVYVLLAGVPAYKDGAAQSGKSARRHAGVWAGIGAAVFGVMLVPCVLLYSGVLTDGLFRLLCGAVQPLSWLLAEGTGEFREGVAGTDPVELLRIAEYAPWVFAGVYALTVPSVCAGYSWGLKNKFGKDMMYK